MTVVVVDGEACLLDIFDTAGQEEYSTMTRLGISSYEAEQWVNEGEGSS